MQMLSHEVVQQYESTAQMDPAHGLHPDESATPAVQRLCEQESCWAASQPSVSLLPLQSR